MRPRREGRSADENGRLYIPEQESNPGWVYLTGTVPAGAFCLLLIRVLPAPAGDPQDHRQCPGACHGNTMSFSCTPCENSQAPSARFSKVLVLREELR